MICLSIKEKGLNSVQDALSKVHLAEIRLDYTNLTREETVTLFRIKKDLIATCRLTELPVEECRKRLTWAIMASRTKKTVGKRYIDIEYDSPSDYRNDLITAAHKRGFNIILSYHNYKNTDSFERLCEIYEACKSSGADIIKIVTTAQSMHDCT
ncbi:MAG TPA: type I 3-dehydroquinate dehydratase, partial [Bacteroidales bacterium]|nr:type I 3-dehydroquinate dehydratase [Bacteroidales bacterium]